MKLRLHPFSKKATTLLLIALLSLFVQHKANSQSIAQDWEKEDCAGNNHRLYSYLDSNQIVVMIFGMGCSSCTDAVSILDGIKKREYDNSGCTVKFFYLDYWSGNTCSNSVNSIISGLNISFPGIDKAEEIKNYYFSGAPMPMIIIAGGNSHQVFYHKNSFLPNDTLSIKDSIQYACSQLSVSEINNPLDIQIFPNPGMGNLQIQSPIPIVQWSLYRNDGLILYQRKQVNHNSSISLPVLPAGIYMLSLQDETGKISTHKILLQP